MAQLDRLVAEVDTSRKGLWITLLVRVAILMVFLGHVSGAVDMDQPLAWLWRLLFSWSWTHVAMAEAIVASVGFFGWIVHFRALNEFDWVKQYRLVPREDDDTEGFMPRPVKDLCRAMRTTTPNHRQKRALRVFASLPVYLAAVFALHLVKDPRPLEQAPPTFWRFVGELAIGIWAYDFLFFWIHLAMHQCPARHHGHMIHHAFTDDSAGSGKYLEPEAVVNHSLLDGTMQVVTNILVQNIIIFGTPKHKLTRFVHNLLVTYLLTESHAGLDLPWLSHRLFPQVFGGAVHHEVHHHTHRHCFQQFFMYLDDLFGLGPPPGHLLKKE